MVLFTVMNTTLKPPANPRVARAAGNQVIWAKRARARPKPVPDSSRNRGEFFRLPNQALVTLGLVGGFSVVFMTVNTTMVQSLVAEDFRGRVMSIHQLSWGATALGGMLIGFLAQLAGAPFALTLGGLITALFAGGFVLARLGELARATQATALELSADTSPAGQA